jgi:hypothetical protein
MDDAKHITRALGGKWYRGYGLAYCPAHGNSRTPALTFRNGPDGRLLARCHAGCSFHDVLGELRTRGLVGERPIALDAETVARRAEAEKEERERRKARAFLIWAGAKHQRLEGSPAEKYLRRRGFHPPWPNTLHYHAGLRFSAGSSPGPALVATIHLRGEFAGCQVTYLTPDGQKAPVSEPRRTFGELRGGGVWIQIHRPGSPLILTEGCEDALALRQMFAEPGVAIVATLGAVNLSRFEWPDDVGEVFGAADADGAGRKANDALGERCHSLGLPFGILEPPEGCRDWNDALLFSAEPEGVA